MPSPTANKCLEAAARISAPLHTRQLASLLFEFMAPGHRRADFVSSNVRPFYKKTKYKSARLFMNQFQKAYETNDFAEYVKSGGNVLQQHDSRDQLDPRQVSFDNVLSEFRRSLPIVDWFYIGNNACWFGNHKFTSIAIRYLHASDDVRRRVLCDYDTYQTTCPLTQLYIQAQGPQYQVRIRNRIQKMTFQCEQPFLHSPKYFKKTHLNFNLAPMDAEYLILLYGLEPRRDRGKLRVLD